MRSPPRRGLPDGLAHAATSFDQIHALGQLAGRLISASGRFMPTFAQRLQAHVLEVLLCILFCAMVRQSIVQVVPETLWKINFYRAHLLLEPELLELQMLHFPASTARQDAFDCRRITVDLNLHVISELPTELRNTKIFAAHLQRSIQFGLSNRQRNTRLNS